MPLSEFDLIQRYFTHASQRGDVLMGVGDDAALLKIPAGKELAISVDMLVAGRHFPQHTSPDAIGYKALAVNLSDMAAMGAEPAWVTLALSLPEANEAFVAPLAKGFMALAAQHNVSLIGGDTVRGPLCLSVQVHGLLPAGQALTRAGAKPGDGIFVSGTLGDAGAGLALLQGHLSCPEEAAVVLRKRLDYPTPRVALGIALRGVASAAIDISDGLAADLGHILSRSGCGAELELAMLPFSTALQQVVPDPVQQWQLALQAGDDYELCFTAPPQYWAKLEQAGWPCVIQRIGTILPEAGLHLYDGQGRAVELPSAGFDHFAGK